MSYCFIIDDQCVCSCPFRYQECHPEYGGSYCGSRSTKSSLCYHAASGLLLWRVPESSAPVGRSCGHHPAQEHVYYAPGHSAGNNNTQIKVSCCMRFLPFHPQLFSTLIVCSSKMQWCHCCIVNSIFSTSLYLLKSFVSDAFGSEGYLWHLWIATKKCPKEATFKWMWSADIQHKKKKAMPQVWSSIASLIYAKLYLRYPSSRILSNHSQPQACLFCVEFV